MRLFKRSEPAVPERRSSMKSDAIQDSDTFRRGRTLTGSVSSAIRSSGEFQADLKSPRVHAHELSRKRRKLSAIFLAVCLVSTMLYVLVSQFTADPVVIVTPDASIRPDNVYAEAIDGYFSEHLSERWRMFTNIDTLRRYVQSVAPEVKNVTLRGSAGFGKSLFEVSFREPIASWEIGGQQLYVDAEGIPFERNYFSSPSLQISDQSGLTASSGQTVMSNRFMGFIGQVIGLAKAQGYTITNIVIPEGMTRQINVYVEGVGYPFKFTSDRPAGEGVEDMVRAHQWMQARELTPEYVDVRVSGRAFYR
jgi:hypothetical protein